MHRWHTAAGGTFFFFLSLCAGACSECLEAEVSRPSRRRHRDRTEVGRAVLSVSVVCT